MKRLVVLITVGLVVATLIPVQLHASWIKTYGEELRDWGEFVQQTTDGGYIATGFTGSFREEDIWLLKTDSEGDTLWTRTYGGDSMDQGYCVQQTTDGGYILTGITKSFARSGNTDIWLLKTDSEGDTSWTQIYGGPGGVSGYDFDEGRFVQQTSDGGYIVFGSRHGEISGSESWLLKTDEAGDTLWTRTYDLTEKGGWNWGSCVRQTTDGGYILTGSSTYPTSIWQALSLIKTDSTGDTLWTRIYGGEKSEAHGACVQQTPEGGYVIGGAWAVPEPPDHWVKFDFWLLKTDENGDTLWTRTYDWQDLDQICGLDQTTDSGYILVGIAGGNSPYAPTYIWLVKTDAEGDTLWTRSFGEGEINENLGDCVQQTSDGGYIITGYIDLDLCLIKTDSLGYAANLDLGPDTTKTVEAGSFVDYQLTLSYTFYGNEDDSFHIYLGDSLAPGWRVELWDASGTDIIPWYFKLKAPVADTVFIARVYPPVGAPIDDTNLTVLYTKTVNCPVYMEDSVFLYAVVGIEGICEPQTEHLFNWQLVSSIGKEIVLKYNNLPQGTHTSFAVFDASGRKVDEIHADESSGIIIWPVTSATSVTHQSPGVYFIRVESDKSSSARKVVLMK